MLRRRDQKHRLASRQIADGIGGGKLRRQRNTGQEHGVLVLFVNHMDDFRLSRPERDAATGTNGRLGQSGAPGTGAHDPNSAYPH